MLRKSLLAGLVVMGVSVQAAHAAAVDLSKIQAEGNTAFKALSEDLASALSYKAVIPAEPLGVPGFDVGLEGTYTAPANDDKWAKAIGESSVSALVVPKVHAHVGLPFGIDVGAVYSSIPVVDVTYMGGELRYSFVSGNVALPAISIRGTMTKLSGLDDFSMDTKGVELSISKGFLMLTPYAGIGQIWATSTPSGSFDTFFDEQDVSLFKWFAGLNINMGLMNFALETDQTGDATSYSAKLGVRF